MALREYIDSFFQRRWPNGFDCPSCGHDDYYLIRTRRLPLYQCRLCKHQTNVTAGTIMNKSRTPLDKWAAAIDLLGSTSGVNALQLAAAIGVTHKVAWNILRKFRSAIERIEAARKLEGTIHAGLRAFAPSSIFIFLPHRHYRRERVVSVCASVDPSSMPTAVKIDIVHKEDLVPDCKELTKLGEARLLARHARQGANAVLLNDVRMHRSPLRHCFDEAKQWMNRLFNGVATRYLQSYLNEFCYRWNASAQGASLRDKWYELCFDVLRQPQQDTPRSLAAA